MTPETHIETLQLAQARMAWEAVKNSANMLISTAKGIRETEADPMLHNWVTRGDIADLESAAANLKAALGYDTPKSEKETESA